MTPDPGSGGTALPMLPISGGCQCGAVRYRVTGALRNPHVCHCRMCQKASGAPFLALAEVEIANFVWTRGAPTWFRSSEAVERGFCASCGTSLHFRYVGAAPRRHARQPRYPGCGCPEREYGCEDGWRWLDRLRQLPRSTTEGSTPPEALRRYASRQHPDHD